MGAVAQQNPSKLLKGKGMSQISSTAPREPAVRPSVGRAPAKEMPATSGRNGSSAFQPATAVEPIALRETQPELGSAAGDRAEDSNLLHYDRETDLRDLLRQTSELGASDLHIEPMQSKVQVRVRIDGVLQKLTDLPAESARRLGMGRPTRSLSDVRGRDPGP